MPRLVLDIETVGAAWDSLDGGFQEALLKRAKTPEDETEIKDMLGLSPLTGQVVTIGILDPDTGVGSAFYQSPGELPLPFSENGISYTACTEAAILQHFWERVRPVTELITFSGRGFDCPFILIRSAVHGIRPTRELIPNRYSAAHVDLFDRLSYYGSVHRRFGLDVWCRAMGIKSPKETASGAEVGSLFHAGRHLDIARYCMEDVRATAELYRIVRPYIGL